MANLKKWIWLPVMLIAVLFVAPLLVGFSQPPALQQAPKAPVVEAPVLTKFGATLDDWNEAHIADPRFAANAAYNPDPNLQDSGHNDRYLLESGKGRVEAYEMRLPGTPNIETAKSESLKEFPADAMVVWSVQRPQCYEMEVASKILEATLGDASATVLVSFQSQVSGTDSGYNPANNNDIVFMLGNYPTAKDAPDCY
jgi:hypothetical protein